jgi:hypothetical protein
VCVPGNERVIWVRGLVAKRPVSERMQCGKGDGMGWEQVKGRKILYSTDEILSNLKEGHGHLQSL